MRKINRLISLILCMAVFITVFSSCSRQLPNEEDLLESAVPSAPAAVETPSPKPVRTSPLTLCYSSDATLNPFRVLNIYNSAIDSLIFENLVRLDESFNWSGVLCTSITTTDGINYTITLPSNIIMHDGLAMTAADVVYSINTASKFDKYSSRLSSVVSVVAESDTVVLIELRSANYLFPALLDIPIVRNGSGENSIPTGTGPYTFSFGENNTYSLNAFSHHRDYGKLTEKEIVLTDLEYSETHNAFTSGSLDILVTDPSDMAGYTRKADSDSRSFSTSVLQYVGFNVDSKSVGTSEFRRAVYHLIDRDSIVEKAMDNAGISAPVIFHPFLSFYADSFETGKDTDPELAAEIFESLGLFDPDNDSKYEIKNEDGTVSDFSIKFIVNSENKSKTDAAVLIADTLRAAGITVDIQFLSWVEFQSALEAGNFDMYYGEVRLTADFNPGCLLFTNGSCNFSKINNSNYNTLVQAYLSSSTDEERTAAAQGLCDAVYNSSAIIPIAYTQYSVITKRNTITGISPQLSSIYGNISDWSIDLR